MSHVKDPCHKQTAETKGHKETLGGAGDACSLDCGDGMTDACTCTNSSNCTHYTRAVPCVSITPHKAVK